MRSRKSPSLTARPLELAFARCWMRLTPAERSRLLRDLRRPLRREWYVVDESGVRRLADND